jgi:hypothetical protein
MSVIILVVGILVTGAGLVSIGFGVYFNEFSLGHTLIIAGTTGLVGGVALIGLAAAMNTLARIATVLSVRPAARPSEQKPRPEAFAPEPSTLEVRPAEQRPADAPVDVSASAIERLRSTIARPPRPELVAEGDDVPLSPGAPPPKSAKNGAGYEASATADGAPRSPGPAADGQKGKRLDFMFRSRSTRSEPVEPFEPQWPQRSAGEMLNGAPVEPAPRPAKAEKSVGGEGPRANGIRASSGPISQQRPQESNSVAILKSGVVDGMAYTLYADGSIEAQLPQGTVRFGSITELRAHIENSS